MSRAMGTALGETGPGFILAPALHLVGQGQPVRCRYTECEENSMPNDNRGFASMDEKKQRDIASKGGKAAHEKGTAHEFNSKEASKAGKEAHDSGNAHEFSSKEARKAGRKGGQNSH